MSFIKFRIALHSYEESEESEESEKSVEGNNNVMTVKDKQKFQENCFKCGKKGHRKSECWLKLGKWCTYCKNKTHDTKDC